VASRDWLLSCSSRPRLISMIACTGQSSRARMTASWSASGIVPLPTSEAYPQSSSEKYSGACFSQTPKPSHRSIETDPHAVTTASTS
jgi:hypothetical protein